LIHPHGPIRKNRHPRQRYSWTSKKFTLPSRLDHSNRAVGCEDLPDAISKLLKCLLIRLVKQAVGYIESGIIRHGDDPLGRRFLRPIPNGVQGNPEGTLPARRPNPPAEI